MKIIVAPDSFKESMTALEAAESMERGIRRALPEAEVVKVPMADGGEGTARALVDATGGSFVMETVTGPLGRPVKASFALLGDGQTAVIEMAAASGLPLVPSSQRNPLVTTTRGTGELIAKALDRGVRKMIIAIGGSATVDGGAGMAAALGARLLDAEGRPIGAGGGGLVSLHHVDLVALDPRVHEVTFDVACDVDNPLVGPNGAAAVYGPQKGAAPEMVRQLDANLAHFAAVVERDLGMRVRDLPGAGAAGGLGAALVAFLGARLRPGVEIVAQAVRLAEHVAGSDLVLTGEGRLDRQSIFGKVVAGVAQAAAPHRVPVIVIAGAIGEGAEDILTRGVTAYFDIMPGPGTLEDAIARGPLLLERTAEQVLRVVLAARRA